MCEHNMIFEEICKYFISCRSIQILKLCEWQSSESCSVFFLSKLRVLCKCILFLWHGFMDGIGVGEGKGRLKKWETYAKATLSQDNRVLTNG